MAESLTYAEQSRTRKCVSTRTYKSSKNKIMNEEKRSLQYAPRIPQLLSLKSITLQLHWQENLSPTYSQPVRARIQASDLSSLTPRPSTTHVLPGPALKVRDAAACRAVLWHPRSPINVLLQGGPPKSIPLPMSSRSFGNNEWISFLQQPCHHRSPPTRTNSLQRGGFEG